MKHTLILILTALTMSTFSQTEVLDSISQIRKENKFEKAERICTPGYWNAKKNAGKFAFKQICSWGEIVELRFFKEQKEGNRAVLTVDLYAENIPRDRFYLYLDKESGSWLIDGLNESKRMIQHFLNGHYFGYFSPEYLPTDKSFEEFALKIISFKRNEDELIKFLKNNTAAESDLDFTSQLTTDLNYETHIVESVGYEERINVGYIHFKGKHKNDEDFYSNITIYISKHESGKIKILNRLYADPYAWDYFYQF